MPNAHRHNSVSACRGHLSNDHEASVAPPKEILGLPHPLRQATRGFDMRRKNGVIWAMTEPLDDNDWPGIARAEVEQVWERHRYLRPKAEAAEKAWKES